jgi:hypothetical protein
MESPQFPAFAVGNFRQVSYGKVRLLFDLKVGPITLRDCNIVVDEDGKPKFAAPRRIREAFSNTFIPAADCDRAFMRRVFGEVLSQMDDEIGGKLCK